MCRFVFEKCMSKIYKMDTNMKIWKDKYYILICINNYFTSNNLIFKSKVKNPLRIVPKSNRKTVEEGVKPPPLAHIPFVHGWSFTWFDTGASKRSRVKRGFIDLKTFNYLAFQLFDFECTCWRLFQKRVVRIQFDIHVFIMEKCVFH